MPLAEADPLRIFIVDTGPAEGRSIPYPIMVATMIVQFSKWGNSLALRIPAPALRDIGVSEGSSADIKVVNGNLVIIPICNKQRYNLDELLSRITEDNLHDEIFDGPEVGSEVW